MVIFGLKPQNRKDKGNAAKAEKGAKNNKMTKYRRKMSFDAGWVEIVIEHSIINLLKNVFASFSLDLHGSE